MISILSAQQEYTFNDFIVSVSARNMSVFSEGQLIYSREFINPVANSADLDNDGLNDLVIIERRDESDTAVFTVYLFNTIDSFYLADTIASGYYEPYLTFIEEIGEIIIVTGNSDFMHYTNDKEYFLPLNCYKYDSGEILQVNDELYDIFMAENEAILEYIDEYFAENEKNCTNSRNQASAIATAYANYVNAGEPTLARKLVVQYYFCDDGKELIQQLDGLLNR